MLHLKYGYLNDFAEQSDFILYPNSYFDAAYEDEWLSSTFGRSVIETIDKIPLGSDVERSLLEAGMRVEDLCTGTKNLFLCKYVDKLHHMSKMGANCYPFLMDIAEKKEVYMAVTAFCWMRDDVLKGRAVHFINDDSYVNDEDVFLGKILDLEGEFLEGFLFNRNFWEIYYTAGIKRHRQNTVDSSRHNVPRKCACKIHRTREDILC